MSLFAKNGFICTVNKLPNEPDNIFIDRGWFVVSQHPITKQEYDEAVKYSILWANCQLYNCRYSDEIMDKLKKMDRFAK